MGKFLDFRGYSIPEVLVGKTGGGAAAMDRFAEISAWHIAQLDRYIGIRETFSVVEIGCGIGRVAIPLTERLTEGNYIGTDTIAPSIDWCTENIAAKHPNFSFIHHDIKDDLHNPKGTLHASDIHLPSNDCSVDMIVLNSVFTHMFKDEVTHYLKEFSRILKPSGRVWASFFLANENMLEALGTGVQTKWNLTFQHRTDAEQRVNSIDSPRAAVLFSDSELKSMASKSGLIIDDILYGEWSGLRDLPRNGQDAVIFSPM